MARTCDRCNEPTIVSTMSMFNTQDICMDCLQKERAHPKYREACEAEALSLKQSSAAGLPNDFPGIGLPDDLK